MSLMERFGAPNPMDQSEYFMSDTDVAYSRRIRGRRRVLVGIGAGLLAGTTSLLACAGVSQQNRINQGEATYCTPEGEQDFTFASPSGTNNAVFEITGAGRGEGDPCWDEANVVVRDAMAEVGITTPQIGVTITIPERMVHVQS